MTPALDAAIAAHRAGDVDAARAIAQAGLASAPADAPLLHFLGMIEARSGKPGDALALFERAVAAAPGFGPALVSLARLLHQRGDMTALARLDHLAPPAQLGDEFLALRAQARGAIGDLAAAASDLADLAVRHPHDPALRLAAARALADASRLDDAEAQYRRVLAARPADADALLGLVGVLESLSRSRDLAGAFDAARAAGAAPALTALGEAIALREDGHHAAALDALDGARSVLPEATFEQMRGELADRAGDVAGATTSFTAMNAADRAATPEAGEGMLRYRAFLDAELAALDGPQFPAAPPETRAPPLFLVGFPRSGTTLLDTFLMGHGGVCVHEERPFLDAAAAAGPSGNAAMRAAYWQALDADTDRPTALQVDKNPLASARTQLIDGMFPTARFLFALRHPCDVVLSCFFTRFRLNWAVASFLTIDDAAQVYDRVMRLWVESRDRLALDVHEVRYEQLVVDPATVLRGIADYAGIAFDPAMLDHRIAARSRGLVSSPSNVQVTEPLYERSVGRWRRYRPLLEPVLGVLGPWCAKFGYDV